MPTLHPTVTPEVVQNFMHADFYPVDGLLQVSIDDTVFYETYAATPSRARAKLRRDLGVIADALAAEMTVD